jgi:hypothetical protein
MDICPKTGDLKKLSFALGKSGGCGKSWTEIVGALSRELVNRGATVETISEVINGHRCQESVFNGALSCGDGIARTLICQYNGLLARETREPFIAWMRELKVRKLSR